MLIHFFLLKRPRNELLKYKLLLYIFYNIYYKIKKEKTIKFLVHN